MNTVYNYDKPESFELLDTDFTMVKCPFFGEAEDYTEVGKDKLACWELKDVVDSVNKQVNDGEEYSFTYTRLSKNRIKVTLYKGRWVLSHYDEENGSKHFDTERFKVFDFIANGFGSSLIAAIKAEAEDNYKPWIEKATTSDAPF